MCAPPLIAATVYIILGRIIRSFEAEHLFSMRTKWLTFVFVMNDVITFCTQIGGAGVQVTGDAKVMSIGKKVVLAGLIFALVVFAIFILIAATFHRRLARLPTPVLAMNPDLKWRPYMWAIYVACSAMIVRNLVRTIQFGADRTALVNTKEAFIYIFDAFLMFLTLLVLMVYHPGLLIKNVRRLAKVDEFHRPLAGDRDSTQVPLTEYQPRPM